MANIENPAGVEVIQESRAESALSQLNGDQENNTWRDILESSLQVHGGVDGEFVQWAEGRFGDRASDVIEALIDNLIQNDLNNNSQH